MHKLTATKRLRELLDERGVFWIDVPLVNMKRTCWKSSEKQDGYCYFDEDAFGVTELTVTGITPEQAIAATLGQVPWVNPTWERWHKSLKHDEIKSIGDAVEQLMYEAIEFGGDMGPNGNTYNGIDEGDVLTAGFINEWVAWFESTLGSGTCEADETDLMPFVRADSNDSDVDYIHVMECSSCGGTYEHVNGSYEFCPRCGRKVVDE